LDIVAEEAGDLGVDFPGAESGEDGGEGGAEIMGEGGEELVFGLVGGFGALNGGLEGAMSVFVGSGIAEDEDDAADVAGGVADGGDVVFDGDLGADSTGSIYDGAGARG